MILRPRPVYLPASAVGFERKAQEIMEYNQYFLGGNWCVRSKDLLDVGGFPPHFGPGDLPVGDDTVAQIRLKQNGMIGCFVSDARVWHYVPKERCSADWAVRRRFRTALYRELTSRPNFVQILKRSIKLTVYFFIRTSQIIYYRLTRNNKELFRVRIAMAEIIAFFYRLFYGVLSLKLNPKNVVENQQTKKIL